MRNVRAWIALTGLVVSGMLCLLSGLFLLENPAWSAVLDGFSINTQDKSVTVTLYTDQRIPYTTETQGRQFTIVLPNAQLAPSQIEEGLPVVIDNKNRFIGRAVPTDDGQVKIILPNLPADEYAVSIQQRTKMAPPAEAATTTVASSTKPAREPMKPAPAIKPRPAVLETDEQAFERITAKFQRKKTTTAAQRSTASSSGLRLSPVKTASTGSTIWNPYVVRSQPAPAATEPQQDSTASNKPASASEPVNAISMADSPARPSVPPADPLWYLHSIPPAGGASALPPGDLEGLAKAAMQPSEPQTRSEQPPAQPQPAPERPIHEIKAGLKALPAWLWIAFGVFLSGLGLFGLIGAAVLLKVLFVQAKPQVVQPAFVMAEPTPPMAVPVVSPKPEPVRTTAKPAYATPPRQVLFQDTTSVNALDYLKGNARSVPEAVQNTPLLRFPHARRPHHTKRIGSRA